MKKRILILLMIQFCFINAQAQNLFTLNSSYYPAPDIGFHNPAPLVFIGRPQAMVGIHFGLTAIGLESYHLHKTRQPAC